MQPSTDPHPGGHVALGGWALGSAVAVTLGLLAVLPPGGFGSWPSSGDLIDLAVYRKGGQAVLDGWPIYRPIGEHLTFTYPPAAAVLAIPLAVLPAATAEFVWTAVGVAVVWWLLRRLAAPAFAAGWPALAHPRRWL